MERYGCLVVGVILALIILVVTVYYWSGWLNRPVGHSPAPALTLTMGDLGWTLYTDGQDGQDWGLHREIGFSKLTNETQRRAMALPGERTSFRLRPG